MPDLAVVGAGPAGLSAAVTAAESGLDVVLVDAGAQTGGQYWRHPSEEHLDRYPRPESAGHHGWAVYADLRSRMRSAIGAGRLRHVAGHQVWRIDPSGDGFALATSPVTGRDARPRSERTLAASAVLLATGASDRQLPIPGWTLPGVLAAGGVQALVKSAQIVPGRRAVVAGTGPFLLSVAARLAEAGVEVVAVCEANALARWAAHPAAALGEPGKLVEGAGLVRTMLGHRIPVRTRTIVAEVHAGSDGRAESVTLARVDAAGRIRSGTERRVKADVVALGWGFTPQLELALGLGLETRLDADGSLVVSTDPGMRTSRDGVWAAGEATGVAGAAVAVAEGERAARAVAESWGHPVDRRREAALERRIRRGRAFAAAMHAASAVPSAWPEWMRPDTVVCRCEEVTCERLEASIDELATLDPRDARVTVRPGMGWCQGRVCGFAVAGAIAHRSGVAVSARSQASLMSRPIGTPLRLAEVAELGSGGTGADETGADDDAS